MTPEQVSERVDKEIGATEPTRFAQPLSDCLIRPPRLQALSGTDGQPWDVYVVLEESQNGYWVVFDPEQRLFGLSCAGTIVAMYGGLIEACDAM